MTQTLSAPPAATTLPAFTFPGRWVGGTALVLGPPLLLVGVLLRVRFDFFFPPNSPPISGIRC